MAGLTSQEVMIIVNRWIGVSGGFLGDLTYRTHAEFYPMYCGIDYDPYDIDGTTRERFIQILSNAPPRDQAKIVRGVLERFPLSQESAVKTRTEELRNRLDSIAARIERDSAVLQPEPRVTSAVVERALTDAEALIGTADATSAIDRVHTALHGYMIALCEHAGLRYAENASLPKLFNILRESHPTLQDLGPRSQDVRTVLRAMASILDSLQPVRNRASLAHPNPRLLDDPEAMLVVNAARTLIHYLDARLGAGN